MLEAHQAVGMKSVLNTLAVLCAGLIGLLGVAALLLAQWLAHPEYFDILDTGVSIHTFAVGGRVVPISMVILVSATAGTVLLVVSTLIVHNCGRTRSQRDAE